MNKALISDDISVFRSLTEVSFVKFPCRLEWMLLAVCTRGEISARIDLTQRSLSPYSIMVLRPGHTVDECRESDDFEGFFILVHEEKLHRLLPSMKYLVPYSLYFMNNPVISINPDEVMQLSSICSVLTAKLSQPERPFHDMAVNALVQLLFYDTLGLYTLHTGSETRRRSRREEMMGTFIDLVEQHFRHERSVLFYAQKLSVTPKHLSAVLKEISGKTAGEWIDYRVVLEAKTMLRSSGLTIQEISLALNFSNQSFFGKYFKHHTGLSPREFRTDSL